MVTRRNRYPAGANVWIALLMLPLLVLMPLLHAHPLGAIGGDHPAGVHFPSAAGQGVVASSAPHAPGATRETGKLATIVVQEARQRSHARGDASQRVCFLYRMRGPLAAAAAIGDARSASRLERPQLRLREHPPRAPPSGSAAAA